MQAEHKKNMCEVRIYTGEEVEENNSSVWEEALLKGLFLLQIFKKVFEPLHGTNFVCI